MKASLKLRYIRYAVGISQKDLARIFGMDQLRMDLYELGLVPIPKELLSDFAQFFNVSEDYFLD